MKPPNAKPSGIVRAVIQLTVHNHPGVMSHVCGLFARRAFNLDGIACLPVGDGSRSRVWLAIEDDRRVDQMVKQLQKLRDVIEVRLHKAEHAVFMKLEDFFKAHPENRPQPVGAVVEGSGAV